VVGACCSERLGRSARSCRLLLLDERLVDVWDDTTTSDCRPVGQVGREGGGKEGTSSSDTSEREENNTREKVKQT